MKSEKIEFIVGIFAVIGMLAIGWLSVGLGGVELFAGNRYDIKAEFSNVAGLKLGATVEIAGVQVGEVSDIAFSDPNAIVTMKINDHVKVRGDDIFMIRTKGIIGDRYIKISRGADDSYLQPGELATETESVVDFEDLVGKIVHKMSGDGEKQS